MLRDAWFIARKDVQYMVRQRETILWTFIMPIVFFYFIGTINSSQGRSAQDTIAIRAPESAGFLVDEVASRLEGLDYVIARPAATDTTTAYTRQLVFPAGFTDSVLTGVDVKVRLERKGEGIGADYDQVRVGRALYSVLADVVVSLEEKTTPGPEAFAALQREPRNLKLEVVPAGKRRVVPTGFAQAVPGTMVMFTLLVLLTSGAVLLTIERREGLLRRLAMTPISRGALVLGKWGGRMALGIVQVGFAMITGTLLVKVLASSGAPGVGELTWGPDLPMVVLVLFVYAGLNASLALLLGSLARSEGQAVGIGVLTANVTAALGGCWWPIEITPRWMQKFAIFLPTGQAMDAMHKLVSFEAGAASAVPHVVILGLAALACGWVAARIFRFQ